MKRFPGMMFAATVTLAVAAVQTGPVRAEETPVEFEILRSIHDPCRSRLEVFDFEGKPVFTCPGCSALGFGDVPKWSFSDVAAELRMPEPSDLQRFRFGKLLQSAADRAAFSMGADGV